MQYDSEVLQTDGVIKRTEDALRKQEVLGKIEGFSYKCLACEVGLNGAVGGIIAGIIVAGVVITVDTAGVALIAEATGLSATVVVAIINGSLAAASAVTVEAVIKEICVAMKAC